jgi:cytoskeletal protein RodZ
MPTFGEELKRERELRGIGLREVAEATKVNIRYLEAMERDDFEHLPGGVFNRGFVRAYAQFIGVDPDAMVNAYLMEEQTQKGHPGSTGESLLRGPRSSGKARSEERRHATDDQVAGRPLLRWSLLGLLIVVIVAALLFLVTMFSDTWAGNANPVEGAMMLGWFLE